MVGRDKELDLLELQIMKAVTGEGSIVNIIGEAGIGKSRLVAELKNHDVMNRVTLLEGRAISMGRNLSFHPIIDLLKHWARINESDTEATAFDKLLHYMERLPGRHR
jgi:predicted ATPase